MADLRAGGRAALNLSMRPELAQGEEQQKSPHSYVSPLRTAVSIL